MTRRIFAPLLLLVLHDSFLPTSLRGQVISNQPVNVVVQVDGPLKLKRPGWTVYAPVVFGKYLYAGDLLDLGNSSSAKVVCSDLRLHQVPTGISAVPCPASRVVLKRVNGSVIHTTRGLLRVDGNLINTTRGRAADDSSPVVLSPRSTKLITTHPTLRWTAMKGARAYKVMVQGKNLRWSAVVSSVTELVYPQDAPHLSPEVDYRLSVVAEGGSVNDEPGVGQSFSLLKSSDRKSVSEKRKQIENLGLPAGPTQFLIAHLYADHGLYAEGIELLEGVSQNFRMAAVQKLLGDLRINIGLPQLAETDYLNSLQLAKVENDDEGQMLLHQALATIYVYSLDNREMAGQHLSAMRDLARTLGDFSSANQAGKLLAQLQTASPTK
jgi:hypothetical protein